MDYSFNGEIAAMYGVDEAVFIHNLYWWIRKNEANGKNFHDDAYWTYNSVAAWSELFPFWTKEKIRRISERLVKAGAIKVGNYNAAKYDHTKWYALANSIWQIYQFDLAEKPKGNGRTAKPIPDSKPDSKPNSKQQILENDLEQFSEKMKRTLSDWFAYKAERKEGYKPTGRQMFLASVKNKLEKFQECAVIEVFQMSMANNWRGVIWDKIDTTKTVKPKPITVPPREKDFYELTAQEMFG